VAKLVPVTDESHGRNADALAAEIKALRERIRERGSMPSIRELIDEGRKG